MNHHESREQQRLIVFRAILGVLTLLFLSWPVYRSFFQIELDVNEAWNAHFDDAAMGNARLYPTPGELITNNYPPLSFYVVGAAGRVLGDTILAGRLLSILAVLCIGITVAAMIRQLGGGTIACWLGALYFIATMSRFFTDYVGMNDPQLLAQAIMSVGLFLFLRAMERDAGYMAAFLVMIAAGFFKHNIIVMPLTAMIWLGWQRPGRLLSCLLWSGVAVGVGFGICWMLYGSDFLSNMISPRNRDWRHAVGAIGHLQWVSVSLAFWFVVGTVCRKDKSVAFCNLFVFLGFVFFFVQKLGDGVAHNAQFDLVIALSVSVGLTYQMAPRWAPTLRMQAATLRVVLLVAICVRLLASTRLEPVRWWADAGFRQTLAAREERMARLVDTLRAMPGNVCGDSYACYRAGKPFLIDRFNVDQRIKMGYLTDAELASYIKQHAIQILDSNGSQSD